MKFTCTQSELPKAILFPLWRIVRDGNILYAYQTNHLAWNIIFPLILLFLVSSLIAFILQNYFGAAVLFGVFCNLVLVFYFAYWEEHYSFSSYDYEDVIRKIKETEGTLKQ